MNRLFFTFFFFLLLLLGCGKNDPCADMPCSNDGSCREGVCECAAGFEGDYCNVREIDKFLGTFLHGRGYCDANTLELGTHVISAHPYDLSTILIDDGVLDFPITAEVDAWNFAILPQPNSYTDSTANFTEQFELFGQGWLDLDRGKLVYQLDNFGCRYELDL